MRISYRTHPVSYSACWTSTLDVLILLLSLCYNMCDGDDSFKWWNTVEISVVDVLMAACEKHVFEPEVKGHKSSMNDFLTVLFNTDARNSFLEKIQ